MDLLTLDYRKLELRILAALSRLPQYTTAEDPENVEQRAALALERVADDLESRDLSQKGHVCKEGTTCTCWIQGLEPDENCPQHGGGVWPPRCSECGRFMKI